MGVMKTYVFEKGNQSERPDDGGDAADDVFLGGYGPGGGPDAVEHVQW